MYRVRLKDGKSFFAEKMEQVGDMVYYSDVSVAYFVELLDDSDKYSDGIAPTIKKSVRRSMPDTMSPVMMIKEIDFFDSHFIPMADFSFKGLAEQVKKEDAAHGIGSQAVR